MLILIGSVTLATQILIWTRKTARCAAAECDGSRSLCCCFFLFLCGSLFFINNLYIQRLKENDAQVRFQKLLSLISSSFVSSGEENAEEKFGDMLQACGEYFQVERAHLTFFPHEQDPSHHVFEWSAPGVGSIAEDIRLLTAEPIADWLRSESRFHPEHIWIPEVAALSGEHAGKNWLEKDNIRSLMAYPIRSKDVPMGVLSFETCRSAHFWSEERIEALKVIANLITDVRLKLLAEKEISYRAYFDTLTGLPQPGLLCHAPAGGDRAGEKNTASMWASPLSIWTPLSPSTIPWGTTAATIC